MIKLLLYKFYICVAVILPKNTFKDKKKKNHQWEKYFQIAHKLIDELYKSYRQRISLLFYI